MYVDPASEPTEYNELGTAIIQTDGGHYGPAHADRAHIATFTPERVLALLAVVRAAKGADNAMKSMRAEYTPLRDALAAFDALERTGQRDDF